MYAIFKIRHNGKRNCKKSKNFYFLNSPKKYHCDIFTIRQYYRQNPAAYIMINFFNKRISNAVLQKNGRTVPSNDTMYKWSFVQIMYMYVLWLFVKFSSEMPNTSSWFVFVYGCDYMQQSAILYRFYWVRFLSIGNYLNRHKITFDFLGLLNLCLFS